MFNLLTDELPETVDVAGKECPVRWTYQHIIKVEQALNDANQSEEDRILLALSLFYEEEIPGDIKAAIEAMYGFLSRSKPLSRAQKAAQERHRTDLPSCDYDHDDDLIYAAFMQVYGIRLARVDGLHWYEFNALLSGLDDCPFTRVRGWREKDLAKVKDAKERAQYAELKAYWALPESEAQQAYTDALEDALLNGGDIGAFIEGRRYDV